MKRAYGGVLIDGEKRVLLREPSNHFGGYVWTFPKGSADDGESPEETALREVREETGYQAEIVAPIPGEFGGDTSVTMFYLMRPVGDPADTDHETQSIEWVSLDDAPSYIEKTKSVTGRARDQSVLDAAIAVHAKLA